MATLAPADTVSGSAGSGFRSWSGADLDEDNKPYWDTTSFDGPHQSVGYFLSGLSPGLSPAPGTIPFWAQSYDPATDTGGAADNNFFFNKTGTSVLATLELEVSAHSAFNQFGWYNVANPSQATVLFNGGASPGASVQFTPTAQYGFFIVALDGGVYCTQSSLNPSAEAGHQHFALFQEAAAPGHETHWMGIEDLTVAQLNGGEGVLGDFNDMVIRLETIPEPSTFALLLLGGLILGLKRSL